MSKLELPEDHLASIGKDGGRIPLYPAVENGIWRKRRTIVQILLVFVFLLTPWVTVNGKPIILLDIAGRSFSLFGTTFWAHDAPIMFFILATVLLTLFTATALFGRVWCGWACPQTVFIEGIFRRVEAWVEGAHLKRKKLNEGPWTKEKLIKKIIKWSIYIVLSLIITHSFLSYFVGAEHLLDMVRSDPRENPTSFLFMFVATAAILFDFSTFREQFCVIACPYGKLQSVLLDKDSYTISYDYGRGEPRRGKEEKKEDQGDCINCYKCVAVCPTGVDIRRGMQLECINCTSCIDACDSVMEKIGKPKGLVRFSTEAEIAGDKKRFLRPRLFVYFTLLTLAFSGLIYKLNTRSSLHVSIIRASDVPYKEISNEPGKVLNHYKVNIKNQAQASSDVHLELDPKYKDMGVELVFPLNTVTLKSGELARYHFFIKVPKELTSQTGKLKIDLGFYTDSNKQAELMKSFSALGPKKK